MHILSHYCIIWCNDILLLYCATAPHDKLSLLVLLWKSCVVQLVKWCTLYKHVIIGYGPNIIALILIIYGPNQKHEKDICGGSDSSFSLFIVRSYPSNFKWFYCVHWSCIRHKRKFHSLMWVLRIFYVPCLFITQTYICWTECV